MKNCLSSLSLLAVLLVSLTVLVGCGGDRVPVTPVSGTVTYKGQPLKFGTVFFIPKGNGAEMPKGTIESDGSFKMGTYKETDGSPLGDFYVRIVCLSTQDPSYVPPTDREPMPGKSLIPEKYSDQAGSGIEVTVTKGMAPLNLELK